MVLFGVFCLFALPFLFNIPGLSVSFSRYLMLLFYTSSRKFEPQILMLLFYTSSCKFELHLQSL